MILRRFYFEKVCEISITFLDRPPEKYWELVAEERRKALEETLTENMKVCCIKTWIDGTL